MSDAFVVKKELPQEKHTKKGCLAITRKEKFPKIQKSLPKGMGVGPTGRGALVGIL